VSLVALGPMLALRDRQSMPTTAPMRSHSLPFMEDLHRRGRGSDVDLFLDQRVGNAIEVAVEGNVIVDVHFAQSCQLHVM